jgi:hypothetical protein
VLVTFRLMLRFVLVRGEVDDVEAATSEASSDAAIVRHIGHCPLLAGIRQDSSLG